jgi:hypothetical protein
MGRESEKENEKKKWREISWTTIIRLGNTGTPVS